MLVGAAFFASFLGRSRKGVPRGGFPHRNQRAEGTKKIFLTLLIAYEVKPANNKAGFTLKKGAQQSALHRLYRLLY